MSFSFQEFIELYPTDTHCLEEIRKIKYPKGVRCKTCRKITIHYRIKDRLSYACKICRTHISPLSETIFMKSATPLRVWFYALFLLHHTNGHISVKTLQKELGVTYKTAWRIKHQAMRSISPSHSEEYAEVRQIHRWRFLKHFEFSVSEGEQSDS